MLIVPGALIRLDRQRWISHAERAFELDILKDLQGWQTSFEAEHLDSRSHAKLLGVRCWTRALNAATRRGYSLSE